MKNSRLYILALCSVPLISLAQLVQGKEKPTINKPIVKPAMVCSRTNTDTIEFTLHKEFKAGYSRIATEQLSITLSERFYEQYPTKQIKNNVALVFQLELTKEGTLTSVSLIRSPFTTEENEMLKTIVQRITEDTWKPATYQGNAIDSELTLPLKVLKRT